MSRKGDPEIPFEHFSYPMNTPPDSDKNDEKIRDEAIITLEVFSHHRYLEATITEMTNDDKDITDYCQSM